MKRLAAIILLSFALKGSATTWYAAPAARGAANGTSYADAWGGIAAINWSSVASGDTIYVTGTNVFTTTGINQYYSAGISHVGKPSVTIRGDYPGDHGVLFGGVNDAFGNPHTWNGPDGNGIYWSTNYYLSMFYRRVCFQIDNGVISYLSPRTNTTWTDGLNGAFFDGKTNWVRTVAGGAPSTTNMLVYDGGFMFDLNQQTNLAFSGLTFLGGGLQQNGDGWHGSASASYTNAPASVTFTNCTFLDQTGISMYGGMDHWTFSSCEMAYGPFGVYAYFIDGNRGPAYLTVNNCQIHHTEVFAGANQDLHALGLQAVCNATITHNWCHDTGGTAIDFYSAGFTMTNNLCAWNFVNDIHGTINSGSGIVIDSGLPYTPGQQAGFIFEGNIVANIGIGGGFGWNGIGLNTLDPVTVQNNTLYRCGTGINIASGASLLKATVLNNIIVNATNSALSLTGTGAPTLSCDYNLFYNAALSIVSPFAAHDTHSVTNLNPLWASSTPVLAADFMLQSGSPARGAGISVGALQDYRGATFANPPSMGAFEVVGPYTYYISAAGSDAASGLSTNAPLAHHPYMRSFTGAYAHIAGDRFIFRGGDTWGTTNFQMRVVTAQNYFGVDSNWFTGGSWSRPVFDFQNTVVSNAAGLQGFQRSAGIYLDGYDTSIPIWGNVFENLDIKNHRTPAGAAAQKACTIMLRGWCYDTQFTNLLVHDWSIASPVGSGDDDGSAGAIQGVFDPLVNASGNTVAFCDINQNGIAQRSGIAIHSGGFLVYSNHVHHYMTAILGSGRFLSNRIDHGENASDPLAHENTIYNQSISTIAYNLITNNFAQGIYESPGLAYPASGPLADPVTGTAISLNHDNVIFLTGFGRPIDIDLEGHSERVGLRSWNNTVNGGSGAAIGLILRAGMHLNYLDIRNNHAMNTAGSGVITYSQSFVSNTIVALNNITQSTATAAGQGYTEGNYYAPTNALGATFHAGMDLSAYPFMSVDYLGALRGTNYDAGAYQFTAGPTPPPTNGVPVVLRVKNLKVNTMRTK